MSLRNRARQLQKRTGLTYQQALARIKALGARPAALAQQTGWSLATSDGFLVDGHAPIEVVEPSAAVDEVHAICEELRVRSGARAVALADGRGRLRAHVRSPGAGQAMADWVPEAGRRDAGPGEQLFQLDGGVAVLSVAVAGAAMLAVSFDARTSLGLVRLRVRQVLPELERRLAAGDPDAGPGCPPGAGGGGAPPAAAMFDALKKR